MNSVLTTIRRIILWDYERATWQYDLLVALIIATVLLLPGSFFGDRDRPMKHTNRPELKSAQGDAQANENYKAASNPARVNITGRAERESFEITVENLSAFLQKQSAVSELKASREAALALYVREELKRQGAIERYETRLDPSGQPLSYRLWLK
jgi:hypothetical protein